MGWKCVSSERASIVCRISRSRASSTCSARCRSCLETRGGPCAGRDAVLVRALARASRLFLVMKTSSPTAVVMLVVRRSQGPSELQGSSRCPLLAATVQVPPCQFVPPPSASNRRSLRVDFVVTGQGRAVDHAHDVRQHPFPVVDGDGHRGARVPHPDRVRRPLRGGIPGGARRPVAFAQHLPPGFMGPRGGVTGNGCAWSAAGALPVGTPRPAAGPAHSLLELLTSPADAACSGRRLLGVLDPADELVAGQRRNVLPGIECRGIDDQRLAQVLRKPMHHATGYSWAAHTATVAGGDDPCHGPCRRGRTIAGSSGPI